MAGLHFGRLSFLPAAARAMSLVVAFAYCSHVHCLCSSAAPGDLCFSPCCGAGDQTRHTSAISAQSGAGASGSACCALEATTECGLVGRPEAAEGITASDAPERSAGLFAAPSAAPMSAHASALEFASSGALPPAEARAVVPLGLRAPPTRSV